MLYRLLFILFSLLVLINCKSHLEYTQHLKRIEFKDPNTGLFFAYYICDFEQKNVIVYPDNLGYKFIYESSQKSSISISIETRIFSPNTTPTLDTLLYKYDYIKKQLGAEQKLGHIKEGEISIPINETITILDSKLDAISFNARIVDKKIKEVKYLIFTYKSNLITIEYKNDPDINHIAFGSFYCFMDFLEKNDYYYEGYLLAINKKENAEFYENDNSQIILSNIEQIDSIIISSLSKSLLIEPLSSSIDTSHFLYKEVSEYLVKNRLKCNNYILYFIKENIDYLRNEDLINIFNFLTYNSIYFQVVYQDSLSSYLQNLDCGKVFGFEIIKHNEERIFLQTSFVSFDDSVYFEKYRLWKKDSKFTVGELIQFDVVSLR